MFHLFTLRHRRRVQLRHQALELAVTWHRGEGGTYPDDVVKSARIFEGFLAGVAARPHLLVEPVERSA